MLYLQARVEITYWLLAPPAIRSYLTQVREGVADDPKQVFTPILARQQQLLVRYHNRLVTYYHSMESGLRNEARRNHPAIRISVSRLLPDTVHDTAETIESKPYKMQSCSNG